jgi:predicted nuclease with RNAse H fold
VEPVAIGVDVSERRGLDVVVLRAGSAGPTVVVPPRRRQTDDDLERLLVQWRPAVVAIDSPPAWGRTGRSRRCEEELAKLGIPCFRTPSDPARAEHPFYNWMRAGHAAFAAAARAGYAGYDGGASAIGGALEVFPHASAVALSGVRPPPGSSRRSGAKRAWRTAVLHAAGVDTEPLGSLDAVDAALAALTGLHVVLERPWFAVGDQADGFIVLPGTRPAGGYPRSLRFTGHTPGKRNGLPMRLAAPTGFEPVSRP